MAKRAAANEQPYRPLLDTALLSGALNPGVPVAQPSSSENAAIAPTTSKVVDMRVETPRRMEQIRPQGDPAVRETEREVKGSPQYFEKMEHEKRILFSLGETQAIDRFVTTLASRLNAQVKFSHVARALFALVLHAESEIDRRAGEIPPLTRPPNGDAQALQKFEGEISKLIATALRDAGPTR